jgi:hypothetical protein
MPEPLPYQLRKFRHRGVHPGVISPASFATGGGGTVVVTTGAARADQVSVDSSGGVPGGDVQEALQNLTDLIAALPVAPTTFR